MLSRLIVIEASRTNGGIDWSSQPHAGARWGARKDAKGAKGSLGFGVGSRGDQAASRSTRTRQPSAVETLTSASREKRETRPRRRATSQVSVKTLAIPESVAESDRIPRPDSPSKRPPSCRPALPKTAPGMACPKTALLSRNQTPPLRTTPRKFPENCWWDASGCCPKRSLPEEIHETGVRPSA